ncbi:ImmA/IrrE family metallo-endopeptidase [Desulforamulus ruminis]|uniref:IrrE N-terminal-like domain-containing protein n=1 Tax=Desulforamulus ruminis (strain ATCC 23193 / DSM 2154 / NCIMB 8452 / DL) TaxID=696281 RepID=F6DLZ9_DESRL|nr:ImmA/IrrE family metallo-endopeptidase [Desulforamulus ruminis]AEG59341.1 protein of unknown function DUF955 [Desulforamulus ruminis DSM 2154]
MLFERLLKEADEHNIRVYENPLSSKIKGLYGDGIVWLNRRLPTSIEKSCVLAEELGHYHTSSGDILNQKDIRNRKQEKRARNWAYEKLVPLEKFIEAYEAGVCNRYELAEFLDVTEEFLEQAIVHYKEKHGLFIQVGKHLVYFEPFGVFHLFNE